MQQKFIIWKKSKYECNHVEYSEYVFYNIKMGIRKYKIGKMLENTQFATTTHTTAQKIAEYIL